MQTITKPKPKSLNVYPIAHERILPETALEIHWAIHTNQQYIHLKDENGIMTRYDIKVAANKCRELVYNGIRFMEQNKEKRINNNQNNDYTQYAKMARNGDKITWGMRKDKWIKILNGTIIPN